MAGVAGVGQRRGPTCGQRLPRSHTDLAWRHGAPEARAPPAANPCTAACVRARSPRQICRPHILTTPLPCPTSSRHTPAGLLGRVCGAVPLEQEVGQRRELPQVSAPAPPAHAPACARPRAALRPGLPTHRPSCVPTRPPPSIRRYNFDLNKGGINVSWFNGAETNVVRARPPRWALLPACGFWRAAIGLAHQRISP